LQLVIWLGMNENSFNVLEKSQRHECISDLLVWYKDSHYCTDLNINPIVLWKRS